MAVEIRELIVKAVITKGAKNAHSGTKPINQDKVVQECVDQVLKIIRRTNKR
jgi:vacuolar-type H+-ATPase subunit H